MTMMTGLIAAVPVLAQPLRTEPRSDPLRSGPTVWAAAPGTERPTPEPSRLPQGRALGFLDERPALDEVITLQTAAGPVRVPYGYLFFRPSRAFLATGRANFGFAFWMPGGRMPIGDTEVWTLLPDEPASRDPLRREHFISIGPVVAQETMKVGDLYLGPTSEQGLCNIFSMIGQEKIYI